MAVLWHVGPAVLLGKGLGVGIRLPLCWPDSGVPVDSTGNFSFPELTCSFQLCLHASE